MKEEGFQKDEGGRMKDEKRKERKAHCSCLDSSFLLPPSSFLLALDGVPFPANK
jgi:hypothetical protein